MTAVWEVTQLALWIKGMKNGWWKEDILETQGKAFEAWDITLNYYLQVILSIYSIFLSKLRK